MRFSAPLATVLAITTGCASIINGRYQEVPIASDPPDARIVIDGEVRGVTPMVTELRRNEAHIVSLEHDGYRPAAVSLSSHSTGWIWGNLAFLHPLFWLIGAGVDMKTGSYKRVEPGQVSVKLEPVDEDKH